MAQHYELNVQDYARILRKRRVVIISSTIIFTIIAAFYAFSQAPFYQANTTVKIEERKTIAGLLTDWIVVNPGNVMETQSKIIKGFPVMRKVAVKLNKITSLTPQDKVYDIISQLQKQIEIERVGLTNIIKIQVMSINPGEAMEIANTTALAYIEDNLEGKNKQARTTRKFIEGQLRSVESRLRGAEDKMKTFGDEVTDITIAEDVQNKLNELSFQLAETLQKYTQKHPKVCQLQNQIKQMEAQIKGFSGKDLDYARLKREVEVNRKLYGMLREKLEEVRIAEAEKISDVNIVDPAAMPINPINGQTRAGIFLGAFLGLIIGAILAFFAETLDTSMGTIEDVETIIKLPVLGVIPSIVLEEIKNLDFLQRIKYQFAKKELTLQERQRIGLISHFKPLSPVAETFRNIKTNIKISSTLKTILITSTGPEEGKTTILANLALVCAQDGMKVLIVSSDLRRSRIADYFGVSKKPGLSDVITGAVSLDKAVRGIIDIIIGNIGIENVIRHPGLERLWILPAGSIPLNSSELLDSPEMDNILANARKEYDVILLDTPPVLPVADASILVRKVDRVILCYEIGRTSRHALIRAKTQLESVGASILGIVLNHTHPETEAVEVYPYYQKYRYYEYGERKNGHSGKQINNKKS